MTLQKATDLSITLTDISHAFKNSIFYKGLLCYKQGMVLQCRLQGKFLDGKVRDSDRKPHTQHISISKEHIGGACSYPAGWNCKHVVAVLCAAVERGKLATNAEKELQDSRLRNWLESLARDDKIPETVKYRMVYLLEPKQEGRIEVHFRRAYLKKDRNYGKTTSYHLDSTGENHPSYMLDKDLEIVRLAHAIAWAHHSDRSTLHGKIGAIVLEQIVSTGPLPIGEIRILLHCLGLSQNRGLWVGWLMRGEASG